MSTLNEGTYQAINRLPVGREDVVVAFTSPDTVPPIEVRVIRVGEHRFEVWWSNAPDDIGAIVWPVARSGGRLYLEDLLEDHDGFDGWDVLLDELLRYLRSTGGRALRPHQ
jgi:hypothetical protein